MAYVCFAIIKPTNGIDSNGQIVKKKDVLQDWGKSFLTWRNYYQNYFREIKKAIENLPKGSFIKKKIKGHWYYYLIYRNKNKVVFKYYGKMIPESLKAKIELRKDLVRKLSKIKSLLYSLRITARSSKKFSRFDILKKDNFTCQYCGRTPKDGVKLHVDHIIPLDKGGYHSKENLITTCQECNLEKHDKYS